MNLENLISKYIDGELSISEDQELRDILSSDPEAKQDFEEAIELHYLLKQDAASMKVPLELSNSTEDKILMRILSDVPDISQVTNKEKKKLINYLSPLIPVFIAFFLFSQNITDSFLNYDFSLAKSTSSVTNNSEILDNSNSNNIEIVETAIINNVSIETNEDFQVEENQTSTIPVQTIARENIELAGSNFVASNNEENSVIVNEPVSLDKDTDIPDREPNFSTTRYSNTNNYQGINLNTTPMTNVSFRNPSLNLAKINKFDFSKLRFTSFGGSDFIRGGFEPSTNSMMNSINQSISYDLDDKMYAGLEFGFSEYQFERNRTVYISYNDLDAMSNTPNGVRTQYGLRTNVTSRDNREYYYASFYFGKELFNFNRVSMDTRIGIGASNQGPLALGKLLFTYKIFNNIDLITGVDGRIFSWDLSLYDDHGTGVRSSLTFVYGLNIGF